MPRAFTGNRIVVASHNAGKLREIADLLRPLGVEPVSAGSLGIPEPEETGLTFRENAELKALASARASGYPALADDSGLAVDALDGAPGIYSARWAEVTDRDGKTKRDFGHAMSRLQAELQSRGASDYSARFVCALCLAWPDGHVETFEGKVEGKLDFPPRGDKGFGYDPVFVAHGDSRTFAEIDPEEKHAISHRAEAFRQLMAACFKA